MATIILHAGMPKAGSSAIQGWLRTLPEDPAPPATAVVARTGAAHVSVERYTKGPINSGTVVEAMRRAGADRELIAHQFVSGLRSLADEHDRIVLSGEALSQPFWQEDEGFLRLLDELGQEHEVVVLYYVRPQDTALEAAWRQWGFRTEFPPEKYIRHRAAQMDYLQTLSSVMRRTEHIDFRMRPFRQDLLHGGDVVIDFAHHGLGAALPPDVDRWRSNLGLALDVVNLLSTAPPGLLGDSPHDNRMFTRLKTTLEQVDIQPSPNAATGQALLRSWAHRKFEPSNRELLQKLGWDTEYFIERPATDAEDLSDLDDYWSPRANEAELAAFFTLIRALDLRATPSPAVSPQLAKDELDTLRQQLTEEEARRVRAEGRLAALLDRRSVKAALRAADLLARTLPGS